MTARLASIHRYPVKGFGGQALREATLQPGGGVPFDRAFGIPNGARAVAAGGAWTPCQAFVRLTRNPNLLGFDVRFDEATRSATLRAPDGRTATFGAGASMTDEDGLEDTLAAWFGPAAGPGPHRRSGGLADDAGYWDHEDSTLSLINLATVDVLSQAAERPVDPLRFRANLYLADLPALAEISLVGRRLRVGDAVLEVLRPIDRCRATSIDPATGDASLNVPALLARALGHVFCGVYARVVEAGRVQPGSAVADLGTAPDAARDGTRVGTAPPVPDWPRKARVVSRERESADVASFWLEDPLAALRPNPRAGQHLRVHLPDVGGAPTWRAYTISGTDGSQLRLSIKRDGRLSTHLHDHFAEGASLQISGPFGDVVVPAAGERARPLVLISAGIGLTPTVAILRELAATGDPRPARVVHVARDEDHLALWPEARDLVRALPDASDHLYLTRASADPCAAHDAMRGRPDLARLVSAAEAAVADVFLCGPPGFLREAQAALLRAGVDPDRLHVEVFASPAAVAPRPRFSGSQLRPRRVRFAASQVEATWTPGSGSLLDLAEAAGLAPPANCRSGACGACAARVLSGRVLLDVEPLLPPRSGLVLLCCAVPSSDEPSELVIDV